MLLMYLRGHLKPGYSQGLQSRIRESLLEWAVSEDVALDMAQLDLLHDACFASLLKPDAAVSTRRSIKKRLRTLIDYKMFRPTTEQDDKVDDIVNMYKILEETGLLDTLDTL